MPVYGKYDDAFREQFRPYLENLENRLKGMVVNSRIWLHRLVGAITAARDREESVWITVM